MKSFLSFVFTALFTLNCFAYDVVRDGGADPTGSTDSTAAFLSAAKRTIATFKADDTPDGRSGFSEEIFIPEGKYIVSQEIVGWGPIVNIVGRNSVIRQITPLCRTFVFNNVTKLNIDNVQFACGTNALWMTNPNVNGAEFRISKCHFTSVEDYAIRTSNYLSTIMVIRDCEWRGCGGSVYNTTDFCNISHSWVNGFKGNACFYNHRGRMNLNNMILIPVGSPVLDKYWVVTNTEFKATDSIFSGEGGGNPVLKFNGLLGQNYPYMGVMVIFRGCQLSGGPGLFSGSCVVKMEDGSLPQLLKFTECNFFIDVPIISVNGNTLQQTIDSITKKSLFSIEFESCKSWAPINITNPNARIPSELFPYIKVR